MTPLRVVGVTTADYMARLKLCLGDNSINLLAVLEPDDQNFERIVSMPMDAVCVYAPELDDATAHFLDRIYMARGRIGIFLLCPSVDAHTLSRAMELGISEVVDANMSVVEICAQVRMGTDRLQSRRESVHIAEHDSLVISFYGTKGGCGKTSLAVNAAVKMQQAGKVCVVVDLDLQFGDAADLLDIPQFDTIADLANEPVVNAENITQYLYRTDLGVEVLCAPRSPELAELVRPELVERIITTLRCRYDFIIFDLSPALEDCSLEAMELSDAIYFVVNPEVPTIRNARTCLDIMATLGLRDKVKLVVNKVGNSFVSPKDVENTLHMDAVATIALDVKSSCLAINRGVPVVMCAARSKMSRDIVQLARKIAQSSQEQGASEDEDKGKGQKKGKSKGGLFGRGRKE